MSHLENPFRQPILPPEQTDPEANAKLADTLLGKEYGDALRSLDMGSNKKSEALKHDDMLDMSLNEDERGVVGKIEEEKKLREESIREIELLKQDIGDDVGKLMEIAHIEFLGGIDPSDSFLQAEQIIETLSVYSKPYALREIIEAKATIGRFKEAKSIADSLSGKDKVEAYCKLAVIEGKSGLDFSESLSIAENIIKSLGDYDQKEAVTKIAIAEAEIGHFEKAKQIVKGFTEDYRINSVLQEIALIEARAGYFDEAKQTLLDIKDAYRNKGVFRDLADIEAAAGRFPLESFYKSVEDKGPKDIDCCVEGFCLAALATANSNLVYDPEMVVQYIDKPLAQAKEAVYEHDREYPSGVALKNIATTEATLHRFEKAKETAGNIHTKENRNDRVQAFYNIAMTEARAGRIEDAQKTMQELSEKGKIPIRLAIIEAKIKKANAMKTKQS